MWKSFLAALLLCLAGAGCAAGVQAEARPTPAPELVGITGWLNGPPQSIAALKGQVVLVEFWTYACINCLHVAPHVSEWHRRYRDQGLVVIGVHTPEYDEERVTANVRAAVRRLRIDYPVALDNDYRTWDAYGNRFWPALYLIDREGNLVHQHYGEGGYAQTEALIRQALARR